MSKHVPIIEEQSSPILSEYPLNSSDYLPIDIPPTNNPSFTTAEEDLIPKQTRKRGRGRRKNNSTLTTDSFDNDNKSLVTNCSLDTVDRFANIPFQRIIFDEDGVACEVIARNPSQNQVNRKHQKRLATSNFKWSDNVTSEPIPFTDRKQNMLAQESVRKSKNLEVRIHRFPNDYQTVVNYWYTTLEWLDKASFESNFSEIDVEQVNDVVDAFTDALQKDVTCLENKCQPASLPSGLDDKFIDNQDTCSCPSEVPSEIIQPISNTEIQCMELLTNNVSDIQTISSSSQDCIDNPSENINISKVEQNLENVSLIPVDQSSPGNVQIPEDVDATLLECSRRDILN